jgi:hypothetical protein
MSQVVNAANRVGITADEVFNKHPDPEVRRKIRDIGLKRAMSQVAMYTMPKVLAEAFKAIYHVSDEEEKALRGRIAEFLRHDTILPFGKDEKGHHGYINWSYVDPHSYFLDPLYAILRGKDKDEVGKATMKAATMFLEPYLQETMGATALMDWARNTTPYGSDVYNPDATLESKVKDVLWHTAYGTVLPGAVISGTRIYKAATDQRSKGGKAYNLRDEIVSPLTGIKLEKFDPKQGFDFQINTFNTKLERSRKELYRLDREGSIPRGKQERFVRDHDYSRKNAIKEMHEAYEDYRILDSDIDHAYIVEKLSQRRVSQEDINQVFTGIAKWTTPPTLRVMDRMFAFVDDPGRRVQLQQVREEKLNDISFNLGAEETDKNMQSLARMEDELKDRGISGQEALRRMVEKMNADQLERFLRDLKKKVGTKYSEDMLRRVAALKQKNTPFKWTKPRRERAVRIGNRFKMSSTELLSILKGVDQQ